MSTTRNPKPATKTVTASAKTSSKATKTVTRPTMSTAVGILRDRLALTQVEFARLLAVSVRSLASLEGGSALSEPVARRLNEIERLTAALVEVIREESLGKWLRTPNQAFAGLKPLELIERGESDRLWEMIYFLRSGVPS